MNNPAALALMPMAASVAGVAVGAWVGVPSGLFGDTVATRIDAVSDRRVKVRSRVAIVSDSGSDVQPRHGTMSDADR